MNIHFKTFIIFSLLVQFSFTTKTANKFLHLYTDSHNNIGLNLSKSLNKTIYIYSTSPIWKVNTTSDYNCYKITYTYFNSSVYYGYFDYLLQSVIYSYTQYNQYSTYKFQNEDLGFAYHV
ncbi:hypothetical protein QKS44_gp3 [Aphis citricidus meson-like virus]|uniref:Uncharacterized protein n=1 Tax=Aphis citricidus meson-like virus TaxID=2788946 RepID=A0AAE7TN32_9NIDO|nr:hypothetical protein QKS44_gp3 [Aphis citricidus meson-like virus]QPD01783.1 hypothetical protein [Aphis citricidus meson-like virus]